MSGFGWSFYGFFVVAAGWCAAYLAWAIWKNRKEAASQPIESEEDR